MKKDVNVYPDFNIVAEVLESWTNDNPQIKTMFVMTADESKKGFDLSLKGSNTVLATAFFAAMMEFPPLEGVLRSALNAVDNIKYKPSLN